MDSLINQVFTKFKYTGCNNNRAKGNYMVNSDLGEC